jgi:uncharacterized protein with PIN domain
MASASSYVLQYDEKSYCPKCGNNVELLCEKLDTRLESTTKKLGAWFYVCFDCRLIAQVGKGEVPRE